MSSAAQTAGIRIFVLVYMLFFVALSAWVIGEAIDTRIWFETTNSWSVVVALTALSGWLPKVMGLLNFVLGLGGGFFNAPTAGGGPESMASVLLRNTLFGLMILLIVVSLIALVLVAHASVRIPGAVSEMHDLEVQPAVEALGLLNAGIIGGFLTGLAIANVPGAPSDG